MRTPPPVEESDAYVGTCDAGCDNETVALIYTEERWLSMCARHARETLAGALSLGETPHDPAHCHRGGKPHLGPCVEPPIMRVWVCTGCECTLEGNPRFCPCCGYTVYRSEIIHRSEPPPMEAFDRELLAIRDHLELEACHMGLCSHVKDLLAKLNHLVSERARDAAQR